MGALAGCGGGSDEGPPAPGIVQQMTLLAGIPSGSGIQDGEKNIAHYDFVYGMGGVVVGLNGEIIFSDAGNNIIRKISRDGGVSTWAGGGDTRADMDASRSPLRTNHADGEGISARFFEPRSLVIDAVGSVYVNDKLNNIIRKIDNSGHVSTVAGRLGGCASGEDTSGRLCQIDNIAIDYSGNIFAADDYNPHFGNVIKKVTPAGVISVISEKVSIYKKPLIFFGHPLARYFPVYVAVDASGVLYAADPNDRVIKKYINGRFEVFSGTLAENNGGYVDGLAAEAKFSYNITGFIFDKRNQFYLLDDKRIRRIGVDGSTTTVLDLSNACSGIDDQPAQDQRCQFDNLAIDDSGHFLLEEKGRQPAYGYDRPYSVLRKFASDGSSSVVAGKAPMAPLVDGNAEAVRFSSPRELIISPSGTMYVWDAGNRVIRTISEAGETSTWGAPERPCDLYGVVTAGETINIQEIGECNFEQLAADKNNNVYASSMGYIYKISSAGDISLFSNLTPYSYSELDGHFHSFAIQGMAIAEDGSMYASYTMDDMFDGKKSAIFKITSTGQPILFAGSLNAVGHRDGFGTEALFSNPKGLALDVSGNLYVLDDASILPSAVTGPTLRKITPSGEVSTVAGQAAAAPGLVDGNGLEARFRFSNGKNKRINNGLLNANLAVDSRNNVYITDPYHSVIRKVTPTGKVSTLVGQSGVHGYLGGNLPGVINRPAGIAVYKDVLYFSMQDAVAKINLK